MAKSMPCDWGPVCFTAYGDPVPKQSFRYANGHGYTNPRVKAWHDIVAWAAITAMTGLPPTPEAVRVELDFYLPTARRVDCDNLSKNVLDAMTHAGVWCDDAQITDLHVRKHRAGRHEGRVVVVVDICNRS